MDKEIKIVLNFIEKGLNEIKKNIDKDLGKKLEENINKIKENVKNIKKEFKEIEKVLDNTGKKESTDKKKIEEPKERVRITGIKDLEKIGEKVEEFKGKLLGLANSLKIVNSNKKVLESNLQKEFRKAIIENKNNIEGLTKRAINLKDVLLNLNKAITKPRILYVNFKFGGVGELNNLLKRLDKVRELRLRVIPVNEGAVDKFIERTSRMVVITESLARALGKVHEIKQALENNFNSKFISAIDKVNRQKKELDKVVNKIKKGFKSMVKGIDEVSNKEKELNEETKKLNDRLKKTKDNIDDIESSTGRWVLALFGLSFGLSRISFVMEGFSKALFETLQEFEVMNRVIQGMIGNLTSTEVAFNELLNIAVKTPYTLREITDGYKNLLATGNSYRESLELTRAAVGVSIAFDAEFHSVLMNIGRALEGDAQAWKNLRHQITLTNTKIKELGGELDASGRLILNNEEALEKNRQALLKYLQQYEDVSASVNTSLKQLLSNLEDLRDQINYTFGQDILRITKLFVSSLQDIGFWLLNAAKNSSILNGTMNVLFTLITISGEGFKILVNNLTLIADALIAIDSLLILNAAAVRGLLPVWIMQVINLKSNLEGVKNLLNLIWIGLKRIWPFLAIAAVFIIAEKWIAKIERQTLELEKSIQGYNLFINTIRELNTVLNNSTETLINYVKSLMNIGDEIDGLSSKFEGLDKELEKIRENLKKLSDEDLENFKKKIKDLKPIELLKDDLKLLEDNFKKVGDVLSKDYEDFIKTGLGKKFSTLSIVGIIDVFRNLDLSSEESIKKTLEKIKKLRENLKEEFEKVKKDKIKPKELQEIQEIYNEFIAVSGRLEIILGNMIEKNEENKKVQEEIVKLTEQEERIRKNVKNTIDEIGIKLDESERKFKINKEFENIINILKTGKDKIKGFNIELDSITFRFQELNKNILKFYDLSLNKNKEIGETSKRILEELIPEFMDSSKKIIQSTDDIFKEIRSNLKDIADSKDLKDLEERFNTFNEGLNNILNNLISQRDELRKILSLNILPEKERKEIESYLNILEERILKIRKILINLPSFKEKIRIEIAKKEEEEKKKKEEERKKEKETKKKEELDENLNLLKNLKKDIESLVKKQFDLSKLLENLKSSIIELFTTEGKNFREIILELNKGIYKQNNISSLIDIIERTFKELKDLYREDLQTLKNIEKLEKIFITDVFEGIIKKIQEGLENINTGIKNALESFKSKIEFLLPKRKESIAKDLEGERGKLEKKLSEIWEKLDDVKDSLKKARTSEERESLSKQISELTIKFKETGMNLIALKNIEEMTKKYESMLINQAEMIARMKGELKFGERYESLEDIPEEILNEAKKSLGDYLPKQIEKAITDLQKRIEKEQKPEDIFKQAVSNFGKAVEDFSKAMKDMKETKIKVEVELKTEGKSLSVELNPYIK